MQSERDTDTSITTALQGRYEILGEQGAGSFGRVYKARQVSTGQHVAIKVLRVPQAGAVEDLQVSTERFRREMRLCAEFSHPNIVRLIDSGEANEEVLYTVFEFVPGATLRDVLAAEGTLAVAETVHLMAQVLDALACAHARGVVHRDLKPENIMLTRTGARRNALVLDFGLGGLAREARDRELARITATQEIMGTPCYAAPEQLRGERPSTRSDLYSWGLIALECLTGELAVNGASAQDVILKQLGPDRIPIPPWLRSHRLGHALEAVTVKDVGKRDIGIDDLLEALGSVDLEELRAPHTAQRRKRLSEGERRQLTFVCCRVVVHSLTGQPLDVEELDELVHAQQAVCEDLTTRNGGQVASILADRVLLVFGYPQAREDDALRAARTALAIAAEAQRTSAGLEAERGLRLQVGLGVHTGLGIVRGHRRRTAAGSYDVGVLAPQVARRLEELASHGEVLASLNTQRLLRQEIASEPAGVLQLADGAAELRVFRLSRAGLETIDAADEIPLVGRAPQLAQLLAIWAEAQEGKPGTVLISGEPGIGKSRLVRELRRRVPREAWLQCRCVTEGLDSPLRPIIDLLTARDEPIESLLGRHLPDLAEAVPLLASLLSVPLSERRKPLPLTPERQRERTLETLLTLFLRMAEQLPLVLVLEDLHWADPTTLELVKMLVHEVRTAQVVDTGAAPHLCLLLTARTGFVLPWSGDDLSLIPLTRLARPDVERMVEARIAASDKALPRSVMDDLVSRSDGIPLFVEEFTRVLAESGIGGGQRAEQGSDGAGFEIPSSLRDLLTARLDGLSPSARETAQLAAVLGREFRYDLLAAVSPKIEAVVREDLHELQRVGLVFQRRSVLSPSYVFKHALVRDAAYESMIRHTRQATHERIAITLRQRFADVAHGQPELVALHLERGGQTVEAVDQWKRAGDRAMVRGAFVESIHHSERALALLTALPSSRGRSSQEIGLQESLGSALLATQGYSSPAVEQTFARALQLCDELGEDVPFRALYGIWGVHFTRGDREPTAYLLQKVRSHAERSPEPLAVCTAQGSTGAYAFFTGDFLAARAELGRAVAWYDAQELGTLLKETRNDGRLYTFAHLLAWTLTILGYPEQASAVRDRMLDLGTHATNPFALTMTLGYAANLARAVRDGEAARVASERGIGLATEHRLRFWLATATCVHGWAETECGDVERGSEEIRRGLDLFEEAGIGINYGYYLSFLAEAHLRSGAARAGLAVAEKALALSRTQVDCFYQAELHRLRGELQMIDDDRSGAEESLRRALEIARTQQAKCFALRAATSLGRLLRERGARTEASSLLAGTCGDITEGPESRDAQEARALLAELA